MNIPMTVSTFDAATGKTVKKEVVQATVVMPPLPDGVCLQCGRAHTDQEPHDATSLRYQYGFYAEHGRFPTWADALAHCTPGVREHWFTELCARGVPVEAMMRGDGHE